MVHIPTRFPLPCPRLGTKSLLLKCAFGSGDCCPNSGKNPVQHFMPIPGPLLAIAIKMIHRFHCLTRFKFQSSI